MPFEGLPSGALAKEGGVDFRETFLHPVFPEVELARAHGFDHRGGRMGFGNGDETNVGGGAVRTLRRRADAAAHVLQVVGNQKVI
jgi:hypothetical protein